MIYQLQQHNDLNIFCFIEKHFRMRNHTYSESFNISRKQNFTLTFPQRINDSADSSSQHINPLNRSKHSKKKSSFNPLIKTQKQSLNKPIIFNDTLSFVQTQLSIILDRLDRNQRCVNELKKEIQKQKKDRYKVKELFVLLREHKKMHSKVYEDIEKKIKEFDDNLTGIKNALSFHEEKVINISKKMQQTTDEAMNFMNSQLPILKETLSKSRLIYPLKLSEKLCNEKIFSVQIIEKVEDTTIGEYLYFVDNQGYLLDEKHYYIVDENQKPIQIQPALHEKTRQSRGWKLFDEIIKK